MGPGHFYLLSYPRSGSTLTRTYFSVLQGRPQLSQYVGDIVIPDGGPLTQALDDVRLLKSHHFSDAHRPCVYLVRDGRNAMLSNLFLKFLSGGHRILQPEEVTDGLRLLAAEDEFWGDHVAQALRTAGADEVCFVRYEDLVAEPVATLETIISFMGRTVPPEQLHACVDTVARSRRYRQAPLSGFAHRAEPGSIYERIQLDRGGNYWRSLFDARARRYFHERGGTSGLLRFGYEASDTWWREEG